MPTIFLTPLTADEKFCVRVRALDGLFKTFPTSPLHHDRRCPIHGTDPRHRRPT